MTMVSAAERTAFKSLILAIALVFAEEGRAGGDTAAEALRLSVDQPWRDLEETTDLGPVLAQALAHPGADPLCAQVAAAGAALPWHYSGLSDGRIPPALARRMQTTYLMGPDQSVLHHDSVRVGLFLQSPDVDYPARDHAAEETFYILSGTADWRLGEAPARPCPPGSYVYHPSNVLHATRTGAEPVLAAWRWTGDTRFSTYELKG